MALHLHRSINLMLMTEQKMAKLCHLFILGGGGEILMVILVSQLCFAYCRSLGPRVLYCQ